MIYSSSDTSRDAYVSVCARACANRQSVPFLRVLVVWHFLLISCFADGKLAPDVSLHEKVVEEEEEEAAAC